MLRIQDVSSQPLLQQPRLPPAALLLHRDGLSSLWKQKPRGIFAYASRLGHGVPLQQQQRNEYNFQGVLLLLEKQLPKHPC